MDLIKPTPRENARRITQLRAEALKDAQRYGGRSTSPWRSALPMDAQIATALTPGSGASPTAT